MKGNKKYLYRYISSKRKMMGNVGLLLNWTGDLVTKTMKKILNAFSILVLTGKMWPQ